MRNAPSWVLGIVAVCITIVFLGTAGGFVYLAATGADSTEFKGFIDTLFQFIIAVVSGGAFIAAGSAAKSSRNAEHQTNGELREWIKKTVEETRSENG